MRKFIILLFAFIFLAHNTAFIAKADNYHTSKKRHITKKHRYHHKKHKTHHRRKHKIHHRRHNKKRVEYINPKTNISNRSLTYEEEACFAQASKTYNVPILILKSIAKTESGFNPYALNVEGKPYLPNNIDTAWKILQRNRKRSVDIGIMQVNISWFKKLHVPSWYGFNTCYNIMLGAYVLRVKINQYGNNWYGIAAYHSATPHRNRRYAWAVWNNMKQLN